ncbi:Ig-like domain-containing protein, partial [bacterium]|nr:Ig-like domain-containing protein [bacterium]
YNMAIPKGAKVFNVIRENSSKVFMETVPSATEDNIQTLSNILFNDAYQPMLNEFVNNLINRIGLTIIRNKTFNNPLSILRKGSMPLGTDIQDIYENPANAEQYELSNTEMAKLLTITDPDTHVAYYRRNRKDLYTKTIARESLQGAFESWDKFENYISAITTSLYSGNYIDEFELTKSLVDGAYDNDKVIVEQVSQVTNEATAKAFIKKCRSLFSKMKLPSTEYNAYSKFSGAKGTIKTWTDEDRFVLIVTADVMAEVDVDVLARAFNIENTKFLGRVIEVDKFENEEIQAILCDESWFQIYENIMRFDEFYNARVMAWNEYLHVWQTYAICPFANAVVLATAKPKPATAISVSDVSVTVGSTADVSVTLTPDDATSELEYISGDETVFTVSSLGVVTGKSAGSGTLTVKTDNGLSDTATVTVSTNPPTVPPTQP